MALALDTVLTLQEFLDSPEAADRPACEYLPERRLVRKVSPSLDHCIVQTYLAYRLLGYVEAAGIQAEVLSEGRVILPTSSLVPDIAVYRGRLAPGKDGHLPKYAPGRPCWRSSSSHRARPARTSSSGARSCWPPAHPWRCSSSRRREKSSPWPPRSSRFSAASRCFHCTSPRHWPDCASLSRTCSPAGRSEVVHAPAKGNSRFAPQPGYAEREGAQPGLLFERVEVKRGAGEDAGGETNGGAAGRCA